MKFKLTFILHIIIIIQVSLNIQTVGFYLNDPVHGINNIYFYPVQVNDNDANSLFDDTGIILGTDNELTLNPETHIIPEYLTVINDVYMIPFNKILTLKYEKGYIIDSFVLLISARQIYEITLTTGKLILRPYSIKTVDEAKEKTIFKNDKNVEYIKILLAGSKALIENFRKGELFQSELSKSIAAVDLNIKQYQENIDTFILKVKQSEEQQADSKIVEKMVLNELNVLRERILVNLIKLKGRYVYNPNESGKINSLTFINLTENIRQENFEIVEREFWVVENMKNINKLVLKRGYKKTKNVISLYTNNAVQNNCTGKKNKQSKKNKINELSANFCILQNLENLFSMTNSHSLKLTNLPLESNCHLTLNVPNEIPITDIVNIELSIKEGNTNVGLFILKNIETNEGKIEQPIYKIQISYNNQNYNTLFSELYKTITIRNEMINDFKLLGEKIQLHETINKEIFQYEETKNANELKTISALTDKLFEFKSVRNLYNSFKVVENVENITISDLESFKYLSEQNLSDIKKLTNTSISLEKISVNLGKMGPNEHLVSILFEYEKYLVKLNEEIEKALVLNII
jgi:hypothetical protein